MAGQALRSAATYLQVKSFVWSILRCHAHFFGALANFRIQISARTARWTEQKSHFKSIPLDRLKADRTFVSGLLLEVRRSRPDQERLIQRAESLSRDSSRGPGISYPPIRDRCGQWSFAKILVCLRYQGLNLHLSCLP
ncbi:MAG: hypothetical protein Q8M53_14075 [Burkholderiales bacterium]|nr:hypothetical protein [Burkholderiales bacterium]